jgi:thiamine pyrophosphate-dependent acetolactate synthase large subunit-like protein
MSAEDVISLKSSLIPEFGSDAIAALLRKLEIKYLAINPGASFRGLHDSVVNFLDNSDPRLVLTLHEAQAVAMAHGYAKVTGEPLGVVLHANVGLMNAVMAIFNAYVDRVPMLIIGATGAVDAAKRRPWIEWIHTSRDQAALVRPFVKWDDQPGSVAAALESITRASLMTRNAPCAPVYVCLDVSLQEDELDQDIGHWDPPNFSAPSEPTIAADDLQEVKRLCEGAKAPLLLVGRHQRTPEAWNARIAFAEALGARVICDQKCGVGFPSAHPLFVAAPAQYPAVEAREALAEADLIISLDWPDLAGTMSQRKSSRQPAVIAVSPDERLHNGWSFDHFGLPATDMKLPVRPDIFTAAMLPYLSSTPTQVFAPKPPGEAKYSSGALTLKDLAIAFDRARGSLPVCLTRLPFGWPDELTRFEGPLDCIGYDGGGGIGSTPGITVGAALALKGTGRIPVAILGDGDLLMGSQALWTAAAERLPALFIVNNNRAFYNDVEHQEVVARRRMRPVERSVVGMAIDDPAVDLAGLARSYGLTSFGPITTVPELEAALAEGLARVSAGECVLIDVSVQPPAPRR